jgi:hypothetical protein
MRTSSRGSSIFIRYSAAAVLALALLPSSASASEDFDEFVNLAASRMESPNGAAYMKRFQANFEASHREALSGCFEKEATDGIQVVRLVVKISDTGLAEEIVGSPAGPITECMKGVLAVAEFPVPPDPPFFVMLESKRP